MSSQTEANVNVADSIMLQFQKMDPLDLGLISIAHLQSILSSGQSGLSNADVLQLVEKSGAGFVKYGKFLEWLSVNQKEQQRGTENSGSRCSKSAKEAELQAEISALKAQLAEYEAKEAEKSETCQRPEQSAMGSASAMPPDTKTLYKAAFEQVGGDGAIKACRLQSMQISNLVQSRAGIKPWEQDPIYQGLDLNVLMRDTEFVHEKFVAACHSVADMLLENGLHADVLIGPRKGIVRSSTKVNVKYGGDTCQLSDITRATLQIKASGKETLANTYKAMLKMAISPPKGVQILHFDDRFARSMLQGYRDFLFLLSVCGILCELQLNYDSILQIKQGEGHEDYEVVRLSNDLMLDAAQKNDSSSVKQHLRKGASPNYMTARGFNALSYAALHGNKSMCSHLLNAKADPFRTDSTGALPVQRALDLGKSEAAEVIVSHMMELCSHTVKQPFMLTESLHLAIIRIWAFLKNSSKGARDESSGKLLGLFQHVFERATGGVDAALGVAARNGCPVGTKTLLEADAEPNAWFWGSDVLNQRTPIDLAIQGGSAAVIQVLLAHGGKVRMYGDEAAGRLRTEMQQQALQKDMAPQMEALIVALEGQAYALSLPDILSAAAERGAVQVARMLLRRGTSSEGLQPKQIEGLVLRGVDLDDIELVTLLISHKADFSKCGAAAHAAAGSGKKGMILLLADAGCPMEELNEHEELPIHAAARAGHTKVIKALHKLGLNINKSSHPNYPPSIVSQLSDVPAMHMAVEKGHTEMLIAFQDLGYDLPGCKTLSGGWHLLHAAVIGNQSESIRVLLAMRCDPNCRNAFGGTPVHHCAIGGRVDCLDALAAGSADLNATYPFEEKTVGDLAGRNGCSAAHLAAYRDNVNILQALANHKADFTLRNAAGQTPMDLACSDAARWILSKAG